MRKEKPSALVTGASSGLGEAFAERLALDGYDLILVARRENRLRALVDRLRDKAGVAAEILVADLTVSDNIRRVEARIATGPALDLLVNNAVFGGYRSFLDLDPDRADALILLQVLTVTRLSRAALPAMVKRGSGVISNVSSQLAFSASLPSRPLPRRAVYAGTKAYINTFTQILHSELAGTGVRLQALCPSVIRSKFHAQMGTGMEQMSSRAMEQADVVEASLVALQRDDILRLPALADLTLIDELHAAESLILEQPRANKLAERYKQQ